VYPADVVIWEGWQFVLAAQLLLSALYSIFAD